MNEKLIKTLKEERNILYPGKLMVIPRGFGKTYMMLNRMLRYTAYEHVCSIYVHIGGRDEEKSNEKIYSKRYCLLWRL